MPMLCLYWALTTSPMSPGTGSAFDPASGNDFSRKEILAKAGHSLIRWNPKPGILKNGNPIFSGMPERFAGENSDTTEDTGNMSETRLTGF